MISESSDVHEQANVHPTAKIWHLAQVRENATVGPESTVGRGVYIGPGAKVGSSCKIQNGAMIFEPAQLEDGVFVGPGAILTNDRFPRAVTADGRLKGAMDWALVGVHIREGASVGAGAVCIAPLTIGRWALVAAGSVVTVDVPDFALFAGNPARQIGWVGKTGTPLKQVVSEGNTFVCSSSNDVYVLSPNGTLEVQS